jgi:hypothetical protein
VAGIGASHEQSRHHRLRNLAGPGSLPVREAHRVQSSAGASKRRRHLIVPGPVNAGEGSVVSLELLDTIGRYVVIH